MDNNTSKKEVKVIKKVDVINNCVMLAPDLIEKLSQAIDDLNDGRRKMNNAANDLKDIRRKLTA